MNEAPVVSMLVVDDQELLLRRYRREAGRNPALDLHTAATPEDARTIVASVHLDIALLDVQLSATTSGLELAREFRQARRDLQIGVFSVEMDVGIARLSVLAGADLFFEKPVSCAEVIAQLAHARAVARQLQAAHTLDELEQHQLDRVLAECNGNRSEAARRLGRSRRRVQYQLRNQRPSLLRASP